MTKGKFGLSPTAVAVIAFGFAALRHPQSVLLVIGFALLAERDEWLNRQAMQALLLTITYYLTEMAAGWLFGGLARFFAWANLYTPYEAMNKVHLFVGDILYLALIVFSVFATLRVLRGRDAGLPFLAKIADGDFSAVIKPEAGASVSARMAPRTQATPVGEQYAPVERPAAPIQTPPVMVQVAPAPAVRLCPACSAPLHEDSRFCTECGAKTE